MTLIGLLIICLIVGVGLYLLNMAPIDPTVKHIIYVIVILILIVYVLIFLANLAGLSTGPIRLR